MVETPNVLLSQQKITLNLDIMDDRNVGQTHGGDPKNMAGQE